MSEATNLTELISDIREQVVYLQELGVESLDANLLLVAAATDGSRADVRTDTVPKIGNVSDLKLEIPKMTEPQRPPGQSRLSSLPSLSNRKPTSFFERSNPPKIDAEGDIPFGLDAKMAEPEISFREIEENAVSYGSDDRKRETIISDIAGLPPGRQLNAIEQIRAEIGPDCTRCKLSTLGRSKVVNSVGNFNAQLMFVGEAPGADEDAQGEPFVGRA